MRVIRLKTAGSLVAVALCVSGCGKNEEQSSTAPAPSKVPTPSPVAQEGGSFTPAPIFDNGGGMNFNGVDTMLQQGQYEQAVISVMSAQRSGKGTVDDSLKLQRKMQEIQGSVATRASAGDQRAIQAMKLLRQTAPSGR